MTKPWRRGEFLVLSSFGEISIFRSFPGRRLYQSFGARLRFGSCRLYWFWDKIWRVSGFWVVQTVLVFCRISAFCHFWHLWFSVFTPMHRVRDPLVFCDDSAEVWDFLNFLPDFADFCCFFCNFGTFAIAILGIYLDAPGKESPSILRRFSGGPGFFELFLEILQSFVIFNTFRHFCHLRFFVFTSMHRVRDPRVFRDDSLEVRALLTFSTRFSRFWFFCTFVMNFPWILTFRGVPPASV